LGGTEISGGESGGTVVGVGNGAAQAAKMARLHINAIKYTIFRLILNPLQQNSLEIGTIHERTFFEKQKIIWVNYTKAPEVYEVAKGI